MGHLHVEVHIDAPVERAWAVARDPERIPDYNPYMDIRHVCGALDRAGTTFEATVRILGTRNEAVGVVRGVEPGRMLHIAGLNRDGKTTSDWVFRFSPTGDTTLATLDAEYEVPMGVLGAAMDRVVFERAFERDAPHVRELRRPRRRPRPAARLSLRPVTGAGRPASHRCRDTRPERGARKLRPGARDHAHAARTAGAGLRGPEDRF